MTFRIVGIGEVLWDLLPGGAQLGGAPANFAYHAGALGGTAGIISRVGQDALGDAIITQLAGLGLSVDGIQRDPVCPTGTVKVLVDADGQPQYDICRDVAWDRLEATPQARALVADAHAVCFGTLAQRGAESREAIRTLVAAAPASSIRILDVNLRQHYHSPALIADSLALSSVLKVNDVELPQLAAMFDLQGDQRAVIDQLLERWSLCAVALTRGDKGSVLRTTHEWSEHPGVPTTVADTVGAGDAFTAAMVTGFLQGWPLDAVNELANRVASFVASHPGATPALPAELLAPFGAAA